jgi:hypothetical protein
MGTTRFKRRLVLPVVLLAGALAGAPAAHADVGETIILRCTHGESLGGFSQSAYSKALKQLSADSEEYTNCASLIRQAQLAAAGHSTGAAGTESAVPLVASPAEQRAIAHAARAGAAPIQLGGQVVRPGVIHANLSSALSSLPSPLLAMLAFPLACLLLVAGAVLRRRFRGRRAD